MSNPTNPEPDASTTASPPLWQLVLRGLEVRLRFVIALLLLAALMAAWPWLRKGWERLSGLWHPHSSHASISTDSEFFCPMDPGIVSAWPAICPVCNMDLIVRKKTDAQMLPEGVVARMQLSPYRIQLAGIQTSPVSKRQPEPDAEPGLMVPASAIVHQGTNQIVYVETMPGMFDGVHVQIGPRHGNDYPILAGLQEGQQVVTSGAFLIDAESRLHSNVATQYFGANSASNRPPTPPKRRVESKSGTATLSEADLALIKQQRICPVTEAPLGSMGTPVFAMVQDRKIFLCCRGCEPPLLANPRKYLAHLDHHESADPKDKPDGPGQ
ncbi:MAG: hypothetical protein JSS49_28480 [Planctomycetes bacterium]|nr:hypothetical protein [Planctomycetota bacterium]